MSMHEERDPARLLEGGAIDGAPPSAELVAMLHVLRSADGPPAGGGGPKGGLRLGGWSAAAALAIVVGGGALVWGGGGERTRVESARMAVVEVAEARDAVAAEREGAVADVAAQRVAAAAVAAERVGATCDRSGGSPLVPSQSLSPTLSRSRGRGGRARSGSRGGEVSVSASSSTHVSTSIPVSTSTSTSVSTSDSDARSGSDSDASSIATSPSGTSAAVIAWAGPSSASIATTDSSADPVALVASASKQSSAPPSEAPPSGDYAGALAEVARGCCPCALPLLERVVEGETDDAPASVQRAEYLLGVCLARTEWPLAAVSVLDEVVRTPAHPYAHEALRALSELAPSLPDPSVLVDSFRLDDEARLATEPAGEARAAAAFLQGRARYDDGDLEAAARLFALVPSGSRFHLPARFYEGTSQIRLRRAQPALEAFAEVERLGRAEGSRYGDLATLALARTYYALGGARHAAGDDARAAQAVDQALDAWRRVPLTSDHFLDAFFEESWALTLAGQDERALGHVMGLLSPFFEDHEHPEALVVRGTIYFQHCLYGRVDEAVHDFHARYDAPLEALADLRQRAEDDDVARSVYESDEITLDPVTRSIVRDAVADREMARRVAHEDAARAELARVPGSVHAGHRLGDRLSRELGLVVSFAHARVGELVRARLDDARDTLLDRANEIDTLALETTRSRREVLVGDATLDEDGLAHEREVIASDGVEYWPFDGEYWEDEVTSYRVAVHDRCGR